MNKKTLFIICLSLIPMAMLAQRQLVITDTIFENKVARCKFDLGVMSSDSVLEIRKTVHKRNLIGRIFHPKFQSKNPTAIWKMSVRDTDTVFIHFHSDEKKGSIEDSRGRLLITYYMGGFGAPRSMYKDFKEDEVFEVNYFSLKKIIEANEQREWTGNKCTLSIIGMNYMSQSFKMKEKKAPVDFPYLVIIFK